MFLGPRQIPWASNYQHDLMDEVLCGSVTLW